MDIFSVGPRTLKTGIAVAVSIYLAGYIPQSLPLLAGVAAIICLQPSITAGVQMGVTRVKATVLGGTIGLAFSYLFGTSILAMGIGTIVVIFVCRKLKWSDGIALAAVTMLAIVAQVSGEAFLYALGRMTSTLIGIVIATATNIIIAPPRHQKTFRHELEQFSVIFPNLYHNLVEAFIANDCLLVDRMSAQLDKAEAEVVVLRRELSYLRDAVQDRYGAFLERIDIQEYLLFEQGVHFLNKVMQKMHDLVEVGRRRCEWKESLLRQGKIKPHSPSVEFQNLGASLTELALLLGELHQSVFRLVVEREFNLRPEIQVQANKIYRLKEQVRESLRFWELEHVRHMDVFSLMSIHRVVFDLEEITNALIDLSKSTINLLQGREGAEKSQEDNQIVNSMDKSVMGEPGEG
ncbi:MAG: FUSC family protein [bacterium]|jgi:uncharacterized membrane protein YgaE (UPF0421/DUF939 family)